MRGIPPNPAGARVRIQQRQVCPVVFWINSFYTLIIRQLISVFSFKGSNLNSVATMLSWVQCKCFLSLLLKPCVKQDAGIAKNMSKAELDLVF